MDIPRKVCFFLNMLETLSHTISKEVSEIFDIYTELHGARISFFGPSRRLLYPDTAGRPNCTYCRMLRKDLDLDLECSKLDQTMMDAALRKREMISYTCHGGMREAVVPLFSEGELAGFVMIGQFRSQETPSVSPYTKRWNREKRNNLLQVAYNKSLVFPEEKIEKLLAMFSRLIELIIRSQLIHQKDYNLIAPVIDRMRRDPAKTFSLEEAALMGERSPSTVTRLFKKITGKSFKQYQIDFRLQHAADLLIESPNRAIASIGIASGFDDPFYFSRMFHKHMHRSPSEYRKWKLSNKDDETAES